MIRADFGVRCKRCGYRTNADPVYTEYCWQCGADIRDAARTPPVGVVFLGYFAYGSFGCYFGRPGATHGYWAVTCPDNSGDFSRASHTFPDKHQADKCAAEVRAALKAEADERVERAKKR